MNIFEYATRNKLRFRFCGTITTEDLWDRSLKDLDYIYKELKKQEASYKEDSLLEDKQVPESLTVSIEIVKHVVVTIQAEAKAQREASEKAAKKQDIMRLMKKRETADLEGKSLEELQAMLDEL